MTRPHDFPNSPGEHGIDWYVVPTDDDGTPQLVVELLTREARAEGYGTTPTGDDRE